MFTTTRPSGSSTPQSPGGDTLTGSPDDKALTGDASPNLVHRSSHSNVRSRSPDDMYGQDHTVHPVDFGQRHNNHSDRDRQHTYPSVTAHQHHQHYHPHHTAHLHRSGSPRSDHRHDQHNRGSSGATSAVAAEAGPIHQGLPATDTNSTQDLGKTLVQQSPDPEKGGTVRPQSRTSAHTHTTISSYFSFTSFFRNAPRLWARFRGKNRTIPSLYESARNAATSSVLNVFLIFIPFAWASHFKWKIDNLTFALCFVSIIPLEQLFDFGGEQMAYYVGRELGELVVITMNNVVEATLAIILLIKCELRILQATIAGVVLLHLLLLPGTAFLTGGARIWEQNLHPHPTQLNASLLTVGVLTILIPTAFFAALDNGPTADGLVSDVTRSTFLQMSHGLAILLLLVYVTSRIFLHNPPGDGNALNPGPNAPIEIHKEEIRLLEETPKLSSGFCLAMLTVTIAVLAVTAEMLVESIEHVREDGNIKEEWFGLVLLPIVSFSADGTVAIMYFIKRALFQKPEPPATLAKARAIDLSVQFTLFWMPFLVLLGWWIQKPLTLLFDLYEVAILLGACFLVNYVTQDAKTNWAEGFILVSFYFMIALCSWFYPGQEQIADMLFCGIIAEIPPGGPAE